MVRLSLEARKLLNFEKEEEEEQGEEEEEEEDLVLSRRIIVETCGFALKLSLRV